MTKVTYSSLKLKPTTEITTFDFNGSTIEVLQYLSSEEKNEILRITLQESMENGYYNPLKKDLYFHLNLVFMYTNISFTDKQREDLLKLYDTIETNGLLDLVIKNIPEKEYNILYENLSLLENTMVNYKKTISGVINQFIDSIPSRAEEIQEIVDMFDADKFQEVLNFAKAANGGRDIQ